MSLIFLSKQNQFHSETYQHYLFIVCSHWNSHCIPIPISNLIPFVFISCAVEFVSALLNSIHTNKYKSKKYYYTNKNDTIAWWKSSIMVPFKRILLYRWAWILIFAIKTPLVFSTRSLRDKHLRSFTKWCSLNHEIE